MGNYKFQIKKENGRYFFALFPNNNNNQEIGRSEQYENYNVCKKALEDFKSWVKMQKIDNHESEYVELYKDKGHHFRYVESSRVLFSRINGYTQLKSAKDAIVRVYRHIDAPFI